MKVLIVPHEMPGASHWQRQLELAQTQRKEMPEGCDRAAKSAQEAA